MFVLLDEARTGLDGATLGAVRLAATLTITATSFYLLEQPIRRGAGLVAQRRVAFAGSGLSVAAVATLALIVVPVGSSAPPSDEVVVLGASPVAEQSEVDSTRSASEAPSSADTPAFAARSKRAVTVAVFGDSVPDWLLRHSAPTFARQDVLLVDAAHEACDAAADEPEARHRSGTRLEDRDTCRDWHHAYPEVIENADRPVDIALWMYGQAPLVDRLVDGQWVGPCEDMSWYADDVAAQVTYLRTRVEQVQIVLPAWGGDPSTWFFPDDHLQRTACVRAELETVAGRHGAGLLDLADRLCPDGPRGPCPDDLRADGLHVDEEDAPAVLDWLLDEVLDLPPPRQDRWPGDSVWASYSLAPEANA